MAIRVLLADDHPVARAGIRAALEKAPDSERFPGARRWVSDGKA